MAHCAALAMAIVGKDRKTRAGETYGAKMKSVEGGMRAYANVLKPEEIQVSAFIRVEYSGEDVEYALGNCGLGPVPQTSLDLNTLESVVGRGREHSNHLAHKQESNTPGYDPRNVELQ